MWNTCSSPLGGWTISSCGSSPCGVWSGSGTHTWSVSSDEFDLNCLWMLSNVCFFLRVNQMALHPFISTSVLLSCLGSHTTYSGKKTSTWVDFDIASFVLAVSVILSRNCCCFQGLMLMLQNLPTHHWDDEEIGLLLAEAYKLKYMFADAPKHLDKKKWHMFLHTTAGWSWILWLLSWIVSLSQSPPAFWNEDSNDSLQSLCNLCNVDSCWS